MYSFNHFLIWNWSHDRLQRIHKAMRSMPWSNISQTFFLQQLPSFSTHCMILIGRVQILSVGIHSVCERVSQLPSLMASGSMYPIMMHPHSLLNLQKEIHGWLDSIFELLDPTPICIWTLLRAVGCFFYHQRLETLCLFKIPHCRPWLSLFCLPWSKHLTIFSAE